MQLLQEHINTGISGIEHKFIQANGTTHLQLQEAGKEYRFVVIEQRIVTPPQALNMAVNEPTVIIADYISPKAKTLLRSQNIAYIDGGGNLFFKADGLYIHIETNKQAKPTKPISNRAFNKTGLKVVFQFLVNPNLINQPYRTISNATGVAIDTIGKVMKDLLQEKQILKANERQYEYTDRKQLLHEWITAYNRILKPKLTKQQFRFVKPPQDYKKVNLPENTYWSGGIAGEILSDYLIAETGIIYTNLPFMEIRQALKLIPDENGNITLIEAFTKTVEPINENEPNTAHPILVYADLIDSDNPRYTETAKSLYHKTIIPYL